MSKKVVESIQKNLFKIIYMVILITLLTILINKEKKVIPEAKIITNTEYSINQKN